MELGRRMMLLF